MKADFTVSIQVLDVDDSRGYDVKVENRAPGLGVNALVGACLMGAILIARKHDLSGELEERLRVMMKMDRKATLDKN